MITLKTAAEPMTFGEAAEKGIVPKHEMEETHHSDDDGYCVTYTKNIVSNRYGYKTTIPKSAETWVDKKSFEENNFKIRKIEKMKNRLFAAIFAFVLGTFGINNFYLGHTTRGVVDVLVSVLLSWTVIAPVVVGILNLVRGCQYLWCDTDEEFVQKFCE